MNCKGKNRFEEGKVSQTEIREKINEYVHFIKTVLHPELNTAVSLRAEAENEICEYEELQSKLRKIIFRSTDKDLEALVDLGAKAVYCQARITDPSKVFVHVGFGFHVEFPLDEAIAFIDRRIAFIQTNVLTRRYERAKSVASHLEKSLSIVEELTKELNATLT